MAMREKVVSARSMLCLRTSVNCNKDERLVSHLFLYAQKNSRCVLCLRGELVGEAGVQPQCGQS